MTADMFALAVTSTDLGGNPNHWECAGVCRRCNRSSVYKLDRRDERYAQEQISRLRGDLNQFSGHWDQLVACSGYVTLVDQSIPDVPAHLPLEVETAYKEGLICMSVKCANAAGAMFRLSLDLATKQLLNELKSNGSVEGVPRNAQDRLADRIVWLIENGHVPQRLKPLADEVRLTGNDGAHDGSLTMDDAFDLRDFSEAYLEEMFTVRGRLATAEARRRARRERA